MPPGFTAADFDCYEPRKWRSNVFNRERLEVKQRLLALAREVGGGLTAHDGSPLHIETSVEHPALWNHKQVDAQHVYFSRNEAARKELDAIIDRRKPMATLLDDPTPQRNHTFLALTLNHQGLEVSLKLHPDASVDRQNLERKLEDHFECERLQELLLALPESFQIGITPKLRPIHPGGVDDTTLRSLVTELSSSVAAGPMGGLGALPGQVPPVHLLYVGALRPRESLLGPDAEDGQAWAREGLKLLLPIYRFVAWSRDNDYVSIKQVLDKEKTVKRQRGFGKNDEVRIARGVLAGQSGIVQEVDAKGHLRVLIGKLTIKVDAADVERG